MAEKFDRVKFNTDPKHEAERNQFDEMIEDSFTRIAAKKKASKPDDENIFDGFIRKMFGGGQ